MRPDPVGQVMSVDTRSSNDAASAATEQTLLADWSSATEQRRNVAAVAGVSEHLWRRARDVALGKAPG